MEIDGDSYGMERGMRDDTFVSVFIKTFNKFPNRVALREKDLGIWQETTWKEYYEHVKYFSLGLISRLEESYRHRF